MQRVEGLLAFMSKVYHCCEKKRNNFSCGEGNLIINKSVESLPPELQLTALDLLKSVSIRLSFYLTKY